MIKQRFFTRTHKRSLHGTACSIDCMAYIPECSTRVCFTALRLKIIFSLRHLHSQGSFKVKQVLLVVFSDFMMRSGRFYCRLLVVQIPRFVFKEQRPARGEKSKRRFNPLLWDIGQFSDFHFWSTQWTRLTAGLLERCFGYRALRRLLLCSPVFDPGSFCPRSPLWIPPAMPRLLLSAKTDQKS